MRAFSLLGTPLGIGPAGTKIVGRWPKASAPISRPGTILSHTPRHRVAVEHAVRERDAGRHGDDIAAEQRQLHAGMALRDAVAHRRHAARHLRGCACLARRGANQPGIALERLVRRQHVVIGSDDGEIRPAQLLQRVLVARRCGGEAMRQICAGKLRSCRTSRMAVGCHTAKVRCALRATAVRDAFRDRRGRAEFSRDEGADMAGAPTLHRAVQKNSTAVVAACPVDMRA